MRRAVPYVVQTETAMAQQVGGTFIDLSDVPGPVNGQVFTDYAHLTPLGNRIVAQRIVPRIMPLIQADLAAAQVPVPLESTDSVRAPLQASPITLSSSPRS
jgi:hypothetical protein